MSGEQKLIALANKIRAEKRIDLAAATKEAADQLKSEAVAWRESIRAVDTDPATAAAQHVSPGQAALAALAREKIRQGLTPAAAVDAVLIELTSRHRAPHNLSSSAAATQPGESFDALATRYAAEKNVSLREAVHAVAVARPDLAAAR